MAQNQVSIDPNREHLGNIYAQALLGATEKAGNTEQVLAELQSVIEDVLGKLPVLMSALESPRVPLKSKQAMLDRAFSGKISTELLNFLKVVAGRQRMFAIGDMYRAARRQYNELRGHVEVTVQTAQPLSAEQLQQVTTQLQTHLGKQVDLHTSVQPELLGGMVIRMGDTVIDTSVAEQLKNMRQVTREKAANRIRDSLDQFAVDAS